MSRAARGLALLAGLGVLCLLPARSQTLPVTVSQMQEACRIVSGEGGGLSAEDAIAAGACYGAMRGVVQVMQANCRSLGAGRRPAGTLSAGKIPTAGDAIAAFEQWAEENPRETDAPAEYGIIVALSAAFPCAPSPSPGPSGAGAGEDGPGEDATGDADQQ